MFVKLAYGLLWAALLAYLVHARWGKQLVGWIATGVMLAVCGMLGAGLIGRGLAAGHWPLTNRYEFALGWAWVILALYLLREADTMLRHSAHDAWASVFVAGVALLIMTFAVTRPAADQAITPLLPALRSVWLQIHVLSALLGYGAFGVAAGAALAQLFRNPETRPVQESEFLWASRLGFLWLTLSILTGAIWAQNAWGRYWGWDPKETWALVTWLWYLLILHAGSLRGWRGRRLAALAVAGLLVVIFTFIGVPWLVRTVRLESLHGF